LFAETFRIFFSTWYTYLIFGMIFGSFLNVVIYRVPNGMSIVSPPSSCPKCGHVIRWYENIPVLGWIFLRGKCSSCGKPISIEYPLVELIVGLITLGLYIMIGPVPELIIYISLSYTLFCIILIDYKTFSIPHGLNITLLAISIITVVFNIFIRKFLPLTPLGSLLGGITGFGILYVIHKIGRIIYKQEAMGMGDLFLLGSAGLILGPKLTLTAFIIGSIFAVISHALPTLINMLKREKESLRFLSIAETGTDAVLQDPDNSADIMGLRMQIYFNLRKDSFSKIRSELQDLIDLQNLAPATYTRLFFRFAAVNDETEAISVLKKLNTADNISRTDLKKVLSEDLVGYDSYHDNYKLIQKSCKENNLGRLSDILNDNELFGNEDKCCDSVEEIRSHMFKLGDNGQKLEFLLRHNRYFQFNGYTAEQKKIIELIESCIDLNDDNLLQRYLSEAALVYFKDFYFKDSESYLNKMRMFYENGKLIYEAAKNIYNIALFRYVFFRQRLAFGPFLSAGIMVSLLWGEKIIGYYFSFLEKLLT